MIPITPRSLVLLALATAGPAAVPTSAPEPAAAVAPSAPAPRDAVRFNFTQTVANIEYAAVRLSHDRPAAVTKSPEVAGDAWYGAIMRRLPGEGPRQSAHYVPFMAVYSGGVATRAWCDVNYNGDLTDDPPVRLSAYPATTGARSFLTDLRWTAAAPSGDLPIDWTIRVVLEPPAADGSGPFFRVQRVHAMMGDVVMQGRTHRAFLFDGNGDGLYTSDFFDGLYVDLDDDLRFSIDVMSREFGPFAVPFQMGERVYEAAPVDPAGREIVLREVAVAKASPPPVIGKPAPDFTYDDTAGRSTSLKDYRGRLVLIYFWASWCGNWADDAPRVQTLYERYHAAGLEILGVSYDTDRAAMERFRKERHLTWPTSFSGRMFYEDPIARMYQGRWPGSAYLVDRDGRLDGSFSNLEAIEARLAELLPSRSAS